MHKSIGKNQACQLGGSQARSIKMVGRGSRWWFNRLILRSKSISILNLLLLSVACSSITTIALAHESVAAQDGPTIGVSKDQSPSVPASVPANHKMESESYPLDESSEASPGTKSSSSPRNGRQYDAPLSTSGTGSYASVSGDSAYIGQSPLGVSSYGSSMPMNAAGANYAAAANDLSGNYHSAASYHDPMSMARGYPMASGYPSMSPPMSPSLFPPPGGFAGAGGSGGLFSGGGSMFPLMAKGFDVSEIVCTAIAVAIGAVIVGAPFILIYLFIMNQMNGNGPSMGPTSGGAISLTGPTSSTTVSGRKKRHSGFPEALLRQLSPLVNSEQVAQTLKLLMNSMAKYQK